MKRDKVSEIVELLFDNDVRASDIFFHWRMIFEAMSYVETNRMGKLDNKQMEAFQND